MIVVILIQSINECGDQLSVSSILRTDPENHFHRSVLFPVCRPPGAVFYVAKSDGFMIENNGLHVRRLDDW